LKKALLTLLVLTSFSLCARAVEITTTNGTGGVSGSVGYSEGGVFGGTQWHVKNTGIPSATTRKGYIRYDTSAIDFIAGSASLDLVVSEEIITSTQTIYVYGVTNQSLDAVALTNGLPWANAPANDTSSARAADLNEAVLLGSFSVTTSHNAGTIISFRNQALSDFINADTNGLVTLILGRNDGGTANLLFAGDTHASYAPPTLRVAEPAERINTRTTDGTGGISGQVDYDDGGGFGGTTINVKNSGVPSGTTRKGYIRFDTSGLDFEASNASLELILTDDLSITSTRALNVYGIMEQSLDTVALTNGLPWADAPANNTGSGDAADLNEAAFLGSFTVRPTDAELTKSFRNQAFIDFINADTNGLVTLILGRPALDGANLLIVGDAGSSPPTLTADSAPITVLNSDAYISTVQESNKTVTLSFDAGDEASKLVVHVASEGGSYSNITYNGVTLTEAVAEGSRNKGIYYLDDPYSKGSAALSVELGGLANGISIGVVSLSGTAPGVAATASASATSVTIDTTEDDSFVMVGYADQGAGNASPQWPLTSLYGGDIGSAKATAGFVNGVSLDEIRTYSVSGSGGSPETFAVAFNRGEPRQYLIVSERFFSWMILPPERPIKMEGEANPGVTVTVSFAGQTVAAVADAEGEWSVTLDALSATTLGRTLTVESSTGVLRTYTGVRVGEARLASEDDWMGAADNPPGSLHFDFETDGDLEGWGTNQLNVVSHSTGVVVLEADGESPQLARTSLYLQSGMIDGLAVRLRSPQSGTLSLSWGQSWLKKTVVVSADAENFQMVYFDLALEPGWKGSIITSLQLEPSFSAPFEIDWIHTSDGDYDRDGLRDRDEGFDDPDGDGLANFADPDSNGNGVSDLEEWDRGWEPGSMVESGVDSDGDGAGDVVEIVAGTNPGNALDAPRVTASFSNEVEISMGGRNGRSYTLEVSTNLTLGGWSATGAVHRLNADQSITWTMSTNSPAAFYRTRVGGPEGYSRFYTMDPVGAVVNNDGIIDNGTLRLEATFANGGSLAHFSGPSGENLINRYDRGRLIQQSYYAGNLLDRTTNGQHAVWSPWTWNPIQGGDCSGKASEVLEVGTTEFGDALFTRTVPLLWDMQTGEKAQCVMDQWNAFEPGMSNVVRVTCRFVVDRDEDDLWPNIIKRDQELPACYFIRSLSKVVSYTGSNPWSDDAVSELSYTPGTAWSKADPSEHWMAIVDPANDTGVGLYSPVETRYWKYGATGTPPGGPTSAQTMHMAPIGSVMMDRHHILIYRYWLIYGDLTEIRSKVYELHRRHPDG